MLPCSQRALILVLEHVGNFGVRLPPGCVSVHCVLPAQRTSFNTLDNWGHKTPTQSKRKRTGKKRLKGHGPEHVYNTLGYIYIYIYIYINASLTQARMLVRQRNSVLSRARTLLCQQNNVS